MAQESPNDSGKCSLMELPLVCAASWTVDYLISSVAIFIHFLPRGAIGSSDINTKCVGVCARVCEKVYDF